MVTVLLIDPSSRGGIAAYTGLVGEALKKAGACVCVLGSSALAPAESSFPVVRKLPADRWGKPVRAGPQFYARRVANWSRAALLVERHLRAVRPDVVHFQAPLNRRWDTRLIRRISPRAPVIWTAHDALPFERTARDTEWFRDIYRAVDVVIVHNEPAAREVRDLSGVEPVVIEHPVPVKLVDVTREEARRRLGLPETGRIVAALGFIRPYKGYDLLADVWTKLGDDAPLLLVMGELVVDSERAVLDRLERNGRVDLRLGYVPATELQLAVAAADALLLPHREASDSGLLHLARAMSVPVIASDQPQLASSVLATKSGSVVPRDVSAWAAAVTGPVPARPPAPATLQDVGAKHMALYRGAIERRLPALRPFRLTAYVDATVLGGAEGVLSHLLAALDPGIEATVMGTDERVVGAIAGARPGTATRLVPPVRDKRDLGAIRAHRKAIRELRPDIFHANLKHPWACQYGLAAALLMPGTKVVAAEHAITPPTGALQLRLKRATSRRLDAHVACGVASARQLEAIIGLPPCSITTIHNGINWAPSAAAPRPFDTPTIVAIGRLSPEKGFDVLLRALAGISGVSALIVGEGPERDALERMREELRLGDRVRLTGQLDDPSGVLLSADALVLPSRYESFPLVILEAMRAGLPVVASDVGSVREVLNPGETGLLVPAEDVAALRDAIRAALDPEVGPEMGRRGVAVAEPFTRERMARDYELLYRTLLA